MVKVRATVDNTARKLKGEMFVTAEIRDDRRVQVLMIPVASTFLVGTKHYAFIEQREGQFMRVELSVGKEVNGLVPIAVGLEPGQRVVTSGALLLQQLLENGSSGAGSSS